MAKRRKSKMIKTKLEETGFGNKSFSDIDRLIKKDGTFNVRKKGARLKDFSLHYWFINMHWGMFLLYGISWYFLINLFFAFIYYIGGPEQLSGGLNMASSGDFFIHCFHFSTQTLTTVGYGYISPVMGFSSTVAAIEATAGLVTFAFITSILYGRFSKAKSKILFSEWMVVSPYRGIKGLKFRVANPGRSEIIELKAKVIYSFLEEDEERTIRRYIPLNLEIDFIDMFPLPWTIVHPLDDESPIKDKTKAQLSSEQTEFIVILKGYDEDFNQYVHQIQSYRSTEVCFDHDFEPMFESSTTIQLNNISKIKKVAPNL